MLITPIQPLPLGQTAIKIVCASVTINFRAGNEYGYAVIQFLNNDSQIIDSKTIPLSEAELANWGSDDTVVLALAIKKLGLTKA